MASPGQSGEGATPGQAPREPIISAWDKGAGVENPIVGPRMEISLIYSPWLPQAFCPRLFVYCSQLVPQGVSRCLAELEQDYSPVRLSLLCQPPVTARGEGGAIKGSGLVTCAALAHTTQAPLP